MVDSKVLVGEWLQVFCNTLMHFNMTEIGAKKSRFIQIGKQVFLLEEVIASPDDATNWTGFTSFAKLVDRAMTLQLGSNTTLTLEFASTTTFNWINTVDK